MPARFKETYFTEINANLISEKHPLPSEALAYHVIPNLIWDPERKHPHLQHIQTHVPKHKTIIPKFHATQHLSFNSR